MDNLSAHFGNSMQSRGTPTDPAQSQSPFVQQAQQGANEGMEYSLWVSKQASNLATLKLFHSMAKQVNDQP